MSSAKQNRSIGKLIVGAMSIDGELDASERRRVAQVLENLGMAELIADVGAAIDDDDGAFDLYRECQELLNSLSTLAPDVTPLIFRIVCDVVAADRFVSAQELTYLSSLAKMLGLSSDLARTILKQVLADRNGKMEISGSSINGTLNPYLKEFLSFPGADFMVGQPGSVSPELEPQDPSAEISPEELERAVAVLGLPAGAGLREAEAIWRETIEHLDLPKMAELGETFVSAAINRITRINEAYKIILRRFGKA